MNRRKEILSIKQFSCYFVPNKNGCLIYTGDPHLIVSMRRGGKMLISVDAFFYPELNVCSFCKVIECSCPYGKSGYLELGRTCSSLKCYQKEHCYLFLGSHIEECINNNIPKDTIATRYGISQELVQRYINSKEDFNNNDIEIY